MIGLGYYGTHTPAVIRRNVLENPAWYTAYTPYQPEISQGRLEALLNFQTMIEDLTALPVAGASMLDEATAAAEAMTLARRARGKGSVFLADSDCLPQTLAVLGTRAEPLGITLVTGQVTPELIAAQPGGELFGVLLQYPGATGEVHDLAPAIAAAHDAGALAAVAADLLAMTLLTPPGELGADIAVGSTQRFGVPMGYGGPQAGYICVQDALKRQLPGRLVGVSVDADGHLSYRLALQAREQHIRREKATSNICTAQVLLAVIAAMYAAYHGPDGLVSIAREVHRRAVRFRSRDDRPWLRNARNGLLRHRPADHARAGGSGRGTRGRRGHQCVPGGRRRRRSCRRRNDHRRAAGGGGDRAGRAAGHAVPTERFPLSLHC